LGNPETTKILKMKLRAQQLSIGYNSNSVFDNISFSVDEGELVCLLGVNGVGKSTLLRTLSGLQKNLRGDVFIDGVEISKINVQQRAKLVSIVFTEKISAENIPVQEFIALGRAPYTGLFGKFTPNDKHIVENVIASLKIQKLRDKYFHQISDGEKQKVLIARALCQQTPVMLLDEPTAFLDFRNKKEILELLRMVTLEMKKVVLLSTHDIESALQYSSKCLLMTEEKKFAELKRSDNYRAEVESILFTTLLNG
jgi:iron complex transport system ATP-binding protein